MSSISSLLKLGGEAAEVGLNVEKHAGFITRLEEMGFEHLGSGTHRAAFGYGDRVLKVARENPLQNIYEAGGSVRYPKLHPFMAKTLGLSESGHLSAMERAFPSARDKPSIKGMFNLKRKFLDLHSENFIGGKAIDYGVPRLVHPLNKERQVVAQALGGTAGLRDVFADVPGFGAWVDEFEGAAAQLSSTASESPLLMQGQRPAKRGRMRGIPGLRAPQGSAPDLPVGRAFGTRFRRQSAYKLPD